MKAAVFSSHMSSSGIVNSMNWHIDMIIDWSVLPAGEHPETGSSGIALNNPTRFLTENLMVGNEQYFVHF